MAFVVLYDANVLYPSTLRHLLIRIAQAGLVQAKWTDQILDEGFSNLAKNRPYLDPARLARTRELMTRAVRHCLVTGFEPLVDALTLPDPGDCHVLAAALKARAQVIVTHILRDFPASALEPWDMEVKSPDDFVLDQIDLSREDCTVRPSRPADSSAPPAVTSGDETLRTVESPAGSAESTLARNDEVSRSVTRRKHAALHGRALRVKVS